MLQPLPLLSYLLRDAYVILSFMMSWVTMVLKRCHLSVASLDNLNFLGLKPPINILNNISHIMDSWQAKAISSIVGGFLTHIVLGAFYLWGNLSIYVASYYRFHGHPDLETSTMQAVFPAIYIGIVTGHFIGLNLARKFGHKLVSFINFLIFCGSFYLASISDFELFLIFMGFLPGICIGNEYILPVDNAQYYYPQRKGLVGGLILCGLGFGSLAFNPLIQYLINPDGEHAVNGYYSEEIANRVPQALRIATTVYMVIGIIGVLMMFQTQKPGEANKKLNQQLINRSSSLSNDRISTLKSPDKTEFKYEIKIQKLSDIFKTRQVYFMWIQFYLCSGFGLLMSSSYKQYGLTVIEDDNFFTIVGSIAGLANGLSRFLWAFLLDYIHPDYLIPLNTSLMVVLSATLDLVSSSKPMFLAWIVMIYMQYGGLYTFFPTMSARIYGPVYGPQTYNFVATSVGFSNVTWFLLLNFAKGPIGYMGIFLIFSTFGVISILLHFFSLYLNIKATERKSTNVESI